MWQSQARPGPAPRMFDAWGMRQTPKRFNGESGFWRASRESGICSAGWCRDFDKEPTTREIGNGGGAGS